MITIQTLVKTDHKVKPIEGEKTYTQMEVLGKSYAIALEAIAELVPEFNSLTFFVTQDSESKELLSDQLLWRESGGTYKVYDTAPTKKGIKVKAVSISYFLYDPESGSNEKILVSLN